MHHELGPVALAVVKRAVPADLPLIVLSHGIEVAAAQVEIVPADAGAAVDVPRLPRLGIRKRTPSAPHSVRRDRLPRHRELAEA